MDSISTMLVRRSPNYGIDGIVIIISSVNKLNED
jgi:hypothetical protein